MKQQNSRMVVEVNKLIANALLQDGGIYLPKIGSISIATITSASGEPTREVVIEELERFKSLITVISERGNCTIQQAEQVYYRWHKVVAKDGATTILGIGEIADGAFKTAPQIYAKLNPVHAKREQVQSVASETIPTPEPTAAPETTAAPEPTSSKVDEPIKKVTIKRSAKGTKSGYVWALFAAVIAVIGVTYFVITFNSSSSSDSKPIFVEQAHSEQVTSPEPSTPAAETPIKEVPTTTESKVVGRKSVDLNGDPTEVLNHYLELSKSSTAKYRVVFGVFSSPSNSGRAIINMVKGHSNGEVEVRVYPYGGKTYMLTLFESNNMAECEAFTKSELGLSISKDLWIHAKK